MTPIETGVTNPALLGEPEQAVAAMEQGDAQRAGEPARKQVARFSRQMELREWQKVTGTLLKIMN